MGLRAERALHGVSAVPEMEAKWSVIHKIFLLAALSRHVLILTIISRLISHRERPPTSVRCQSVYLLVAYSAYFRTSQMSEPLPYNSLPDIADVGTLAYSKLIPDVKR
jgi:hypothetical protein